MNGLAHPAQALLSAGFEQDSGAISCAPIAERQRLVLTASTVCGGTVLFIRQLPNGARPPRLGVFQFQAFAFCKSAWYAAIQADWLLRSALRSAS